MRRDARRLLPAVAAAMLATAGRADDPSALEELASLLEAQVGVGRAAIESGLDGLQPALAGAAAPAVAALIAASRDAAIASGVEPIPESIRREIADYVPADVLDAVRWCVRCGGELSLQRSTFLLGIAPAITLDHVIVFAKLDDALNDPALWMHELKHVMQFREWGLDEFARRYLEDYAAVEREAWDFRWAWVKSTGWLERRKLARR
ncbi:MAG: DUF4157 domain-containing protein [Gammaproteobacteria bacterium]|nr:hypothetical protein [Gammaproteobacteria bacterium]